jgi:hypothetical protein
MNSLAVLAAVGLAVGLVAFAAPSLGERTVSDFAPLRRVSDRLDAAMGWRAARRAEQRSFARGALHGGCHVVVGASKAAVGNFTGSRAELRRAAVQFRRALGLPTRERAS